MTFYTEAFAAFLPIVWMTFTLRMLPFVVYACASPRVAPRQTGIALLGFGMVVATVVAHDASAVVTLIAQMVCLGYFAICAFAIWCLASQVRPWTGPAHGLLCVGLFAVCVVLPKVCLPAPADTVAVPFGWEFGLAAYSYAREVRRVHARPPLADGLFFLMVNPVLVYAERSRLAQHAAAGNVHCARIVLGVLALLIHCAIRTAETTWSGGAFLLQQALHFVAAYVLFSGTASLQIGTLRLLGYAVPERFAHPLAAKNPMDFWRRWNTYVGSWARRYLFLPMTTAVRRRLSGQRLAAPISVSVAAMATFMLVGAYHDLGAFVAQGTLSIGCVVTFALSGAIVLLWSAAERWFARSPRRIRSPQTIAAWLSWSGASRLSFLFLLLVNAWIASSTTSGASMLTVDGVVRWLQSAL